MVHLHWAPRVFLALCLALVGAAPAQAQQRGSAYNQDAWKRAQAQRAAFLKHYQAGAYDKAIAAGEASLKLRIQLYGEVHIATAQMMEDLAKVHLQIGRAYAAGGYFERALRIRTSLEGTTGLHTLQNQANLGTIAGMQGRYEEALTLLNGAQTGYLRKFGADHPDTVMVSYGLAIQYEEVGLYAQALEIFEDVLRAKRKALGERDPEVGQIMNAVAAMHLDLGNVEEGMALQRQALAIHTDATGPAPAISGGVVREFSMARPNGLHSMALFLVARGQLDQALNYAMQAREGFVEVVGAGNPWVGTTEQFIGAMHLYRGEPTKAVEWANRALAVFEKAYGAAHPETTSARHFLADAHARMPNPGKAVPYLRDALDQEDLLFERRLLSAHASEADKYLYYNNKVRSSTDSTVSLALNQLPDDREAADLALRTVLRRKARVLDAQTAILEQLQQRLDKEDREIYAQWQAMLTELSARALEAPPDGTQSTHARRLKALSGELAQLERELKSLQERLAANNDQFRLTTADISTAGVADRLPPETALIEYVYYRPYEPEMVRKRAQQGHTDPAYGEPRYAAAILKQDGRVHWVQLGSAEDIDKRIRKFLLMVKLRGEHRKFSRPVYEAVLAPLETHLKGVSHLLVAPDGELNLLPLGTLAVGDDAFLIQKYEISYLTSGRELLRLGHPQSTRDPVTVFAAPEYGKLDKESEKFDVLAQRGEVANLQDLRDVQWPDLDGTAEEASALRTHLGRKTRVVLGRRATETSLKTIQSPRILHIATHGFVLSDKESLFGKDGRGLELVVDTDAQSGISLSHLVDDPLLRAGLVFAGANGLEGDGENDGILTAKEAVGLQLAGTRLVTLSACETGMGEVRTGEGVYGLRRSFALAGAETVLMSLWKVNDEATAEWMSRYYLRLARGEGRSEAMRAVQLEMVTEPRWEHPFFWGAFIVSGDWGAID